MEIDIGTRVSIGASGKSGIVRYVGEVDGLAGDWVGIELDKPEGKHSGDLNGKVYFTCPANHGVFVRKMQVRPVTMRTPSSRLSLGGAGLATTSAASSRLQQMRERRASGIGLTGGSAAGPRQAAPPSSAPSPGATRTHNTSTSGSSASSIGSARRSPTPSASASSAGAPSSGSSRLSLEPGARRPMISRTPSSGPSDELLEARSRIAKLQEEVDDRNRTVEQLKQTVVALRESLERSSENATSKKQEQEEMETTPMEVDRDENENTDDAWLEKIESIKQEAEEHVRQVRAELEEHIAQLQSENEELVDELRLENATQTSEIKSLEAEIAQQKARIAQFTASEQRKAEEVAHAIAKTSAGARKVESLEKQLTEHQEMIEKLILEKETLEVDKEIAEERVDLLEAEIEQLKASLALASTSQRSAHVSSSAAELSEENLKLRAAIKALHDRSSDEKNELNKKVRQLQRECAELVNLQEEVEQLTQAKSKLEGEVEELKELLDVANAYESMVEDLTEKNLTLGDKVAELEVAVNSLESLKEMSDEMEHQHTEYEAELTSEIESLRSTIFDLKNALTDQQTVVEDRDRTIARFRDATAKNREEINQLKAQLRAETGEVEMLKGTAHSAMSQTMTLRNLVASAAEHQVEAARQRIHAEQARMENAFLRAAIPSTVFSEVDQKVLRVRLRLGRIAGKAEIISQYLRKDIDAMMQRDSKEDPTPSVIDSERAIQLLLLGDKLSTVSCQAREDLFVLECHLTTTDEYVSLCTVLDTPQFGVLEASLDGGMAACAEGALFTSRVGETPPYNRLLTALDEWHSTRAGGDTVSEGFPMRCAVVKLRSRKNVVTLECMLSAIFVFVKTMRSITITAEAPIDESVKPVVVEVFEKVLEEGLALCKLAQHLHRRVEIDLAAADDDLDGSVAVGGDVVELVHAYASECQNLWAVTQEHLTMATLQGDCKTTIEFAQNSLLCMLSSLKDRIANLFKGVCRGSLTDAVASRTRDQMNSSEDREGRSQWQVRAHAIHNELLNASSLRAKLQEANDLCQALHSRVRELDRTDSQHRVVAQKLESEVLSLNESLTQVSAEKSRLEEQLAREREQFNLALDESHKDKIALDNLNRELRKQLKRSNEMESTVPSGSTRGKSALSQGDAEAFRKAFDHLHQELHRLRAQLAHERLDRVLGPRLPQTAKKPLQPSDRLAQCSQDVARLSNRIRTHMSMPRMVDLTKSPASEQRLQHKLESCKLAQSLADLRARISSVVKEDGQRGATMAQAIELGETAFGWQPPEMERPPVLVGRVTLRSTPTQQGDGDDAMLDVEPTPAAPVPLLLNQLQVQQLSRALVC
ncbi:hypothetical protein PINS_up003957 [Pythium insidiosum]|nr:hypothetical protein PINS_up003957 [Pythium insidiosum]